MVTFLDILLLTFGCILGIIGTTFALFSAYLVYVHRKYSHIPGPPLTSFFFGHISYLKEYGKNGAYPFRVLIEWAEEYGPLFKIFTLHQCLLIPSSESLIKEILTKKKYPKSKMAYKRLEKLCGERFLGSGLVTNTDHQEWAERRKAVDPAFHRKTLKSMISEFNEVGNYWTDQLAKHAASEKMFCMAKVLGRISLDVIGRVGFDMNFGASESEDCEIVNAFNKILEGLTQHVHDPFFQWKLSQKGLRKEVSESLKYLREYSKSEINSRNANEHISIKQSNDIMTYLLKSQKGNTNIATEDTIDDFMTFFIAGQETISHAMAFLLCEIGRHPEVLERLRYEIEAHIGDKDIIDYEDLGKLEYMNNVWKETLRLYPPAPATAREITEDCEIEGFKLPAGSFVMINFYMIQRLGVHFEDPLTFDPDRWSGSQPLFAYMPFSLGYRACMGKSFAQIEFKILLTKFLQQYDYTLDPEQSFEVEEMSTLRPKGGAMMTIHKRNITKDIEL